MNDLEMTKLCAQAMDYHFEYGQEPLDCVQYIANAYYLGGPYDPLQNDMQAMELLKKFELCVVSPSTEDKDPLWHAGSRIGRQFDAHNTSLNRTIVECVANLQKSNNGTKIDV